MLWYETLLHVCTKHLLADRMLITAREMGNHSHLIKFKAFELCIKLKLQNLSAVKQQYN